MEQYFVVQSSFGIVLHNLELYWSNINSNKVLFCHMEYFANINLYWGRIN